MKKYTTANVITVILLTISALIHFGTIKKEVFIYEVWFFIPLTLFLVLLTIVILENIILKVFTILKIVLMSISILLLAYIYIDAAINFIPEIQEVFDFFMVKDGGLRYL